MFLKVYKFKLLMALMLVPFLVSADPPGWDKTETLFTNVMNIPVDVVPMLQGAALEDGAWVGVFFDDNGVLKCGGSVEYMAGVVTGFSSFGDDPITPAKDGFTPGESFTWAVYTEGGGTVYGEATYAAKGVGVFTLPFFTHTLSSLTAPAALAVSASASPDLFCGTGGDATLTATDISGVATAWEWFDNGTSVGTGNGLTVPVTETTTFRVEASDGVSTAEAFVTVIVNTVFAGDDFAACGDGGALTLADAMVSDFLTVEWTTSGTGTFDDAGVVNAVYNPVVADGDVTLTLTVVSLDCGAMSDEVAITFQAAPSIEILPDQDWVCIGESFPFAGLVDGMDYDALQWFTTNGGGVFDNETIIDPVYFPSPTIDYVQGCIIIGVTASAIDPCVVAADDYMDLIFVAAPTADAGAGTSVCADVATSFTFADAAVTFTPIVNPLICGDLTNVITWTHNGDGTLDDATIQNPTYTFGPNDIALGGDIEFTLTAETMEACGAATSMATLHVELAPEIDIIPDAYTICEGDVMDFAGLVIGSNYESVQWFTPNGGGVYNDETLLEPVYFPSPTIDYPQVCIILGVAAAPNDPCTVSAEDFMDLCWQMLPTVVAGDDATICANETYTTAPTVTNSAGPYMWTHNGAGSFDDPTLLNATYFPEVADTYNTVTLTLTAAPIGPCAEPGVGSMDLYIECAPYVNAGPDMTICETESANLVCEAECVEFVMWATTGDGHFLCPGCIQGGTVYYPGPGDLAAGCVTLVLVGYPLDPCTMWEVDKMVLCFDPAPMVDAGADATTCEDTPYQLDGSEMNTCGIQWVTLDGTGTFDDETIVNPVYTPSAMDAITGTVNLIMVGAPCGACTEPAQDTMALTIQRRPQVFAGDANIFCEDGSFELLDATADFVSSVMWTGGTGTFDPSADVLNPTYTPSQDEIDAGFVNLTLHGYTVAPCVGEETSDILLTIQCLPEINIIPDAATICYGDSFDFTGLVEGGCYETLQWFTTNGGGVYSSEIILEPTYFPSPTIDYPQNCVILGVAAAPIDPCSVASEDFMDLCFQPPVEVDAGDDATICEDASYTLMPVIENGGAVLWSTSGTGAFDDATLAGATYTPSADDIMMGYVTLCIEVQGLSTCPAESDCMTLYFQLNPIANAGEDQTVCEHLCLPPNPWANGQAFLMDATVENNCGLEWSTLGDGTFSDMGALNPVYTLGDADIAAGSVELCLTAEACDPCAVADVDCVTITVQPFATADAGPDVTVCEGDAAQLDGTSTDAVGVFWDFALLGEGDGMFSNQVIEDPMYYPGAQDILDGQVELIFVAFPIDPCTYPDVDVMTVYITRQPVANAGDDATICANETYTLAGSVEFATGGFEWSTTGDGTFDDINSLTATYTHGPLDEAAGTVDLCLAAFDATACTADYSDCMTLTILPPPTVDAGADASICVEGSFTTSPTIVSANTYVVEWTHNGTGMFDDAALEAATYTPGLGDEGNDVTLTITVTPDLPCTTPVSDFLTLTIYPQPAIGFCFDGELAGTGSMFEYCYNETVNVSLCEVWAGTGPFDICYTVNGGSEVCVVGVADGDVFASEVLPVGTNVIQITSITDANGCTSLDVTPYWAEVVVHPEPALGFCFDGDLAETGSVFEYCYDETVNVSLCEVWAGTGPFDICYTVNNGPEVCVVGVDLTDVFASEILPVGTNVINITSITDANGCVADVTPYMAEVIVNPEPTLEVTLNGATPDALNEFCFDDTFEICMAGVDGTADWTVEWSVTGPSGTFGDVMTGTDGCWSFNAIDYLPGVYDLTVVSLTDAKGCVATQATLDSYAFQIQINPEPDAHMCFNGVQAGYGDTFEYCYDETVEVTLCEILIGEAPFTVCWTVNGGAEECVTVDEGGVLFSEILPAGTYDVQVTSMTDANGCMLADPTPYAATVIVHDQPFVGFCFNTVLAGTGDTFEYCYDDEIDVTLCEVWGGTGPFTINYSIDGVPQAEVVVNQGESLFTGIMAPGTYLIEVTSIVDFYGCVASDVTPYMATVVVHPEPDAHMCFNGVQAGYGDTFEYCYDEAVIVTLCEVLSGDEPITVCWTINGGAEECATVVEGGELFNEVLAPGTYEVQVTSMTDANGCVLADPTPYAATVVVHPEPVAAFCFNDELAATGTIFEYCYDETVVATLCEIVEGTGPFTVCWTVNGGPEECATLDVDGVLFSGVMAPGTYVVQVTSIVDAEGCGVADTAPYTATVVVHPEPSLGFCFNGVEAGSGDILDFCETETVVVDLCAVNAGTGPFEVCYDILFNGAPLVTGECQTVSLGDQLWNDLVGPGQYVVTVTSIMDANGCVVADPGLYTVTVNIQPEPVVDAGADGTTCEETAYMLDGTVENVSSVMWTGGLGTFDDPTLVDATYTPAAGEFGAVVLTLTGYPIAPCMMEYFDTMELFIQEGPSADAGGDQTVCDNVPEVQLDGECLNGSSVYWYTPDGFGFFSDEYVCVTQYIPSPEDIAAGSVTLCLQVYAIQPCVGYDENCITLTFAPSPVANAGADATICEDDTYQLAGSADNYDYFEWTTSGDGTFDNVNALDAIYTHGPIDATNGGVELCLTSYPTGGCLEEDVDCMYLTIVAKPIVDLGADRSLDCEDYDFTNTEWLPVMVDAIITNGYSSVQWTTNGTGFFDDATAVNAVYHLSSADIWDGEIELCVEVAGEGSCAFVATDCITIYVPQQIILFDQDSWWGVSSYLDPTLATVPEVMAPIVVDPIDATGSRHLVIQIDKAGKYYWPEPVPAINQLGNWLPLPNELPIGYKAKIKYAPACLPIFGDTLTTNTFEISGAFTYVPVLTNVNVNILDLFGADTANILLIYDWVSQDAWFPDVLDQLTEFTPGKAYLLVNRNPFGAPYTVDFPDYDPNVTFVTGALAGADAGNNSPWNDVENTALPHFLMFANQVLAEMLPGDIIGAFNQDDVCVGMSEFADRDAFFKVVAMGNDPLTQAIDGFETGEFMNFKLYRQATGETFEVSFTYDAQYPNYNGLYAVNGVSKVVGMTMSITGVNDINSNYNVNVYPNPAHDVINIASDYNMKSVTLVNYVGQTVFTQAVNGNSYQINVSNYVTGMYFVRIETTDGNVITKRIAVD